MTGRAEEGGHLELFSRALGKHLKVARLGLGDDPGAAMALFDKTLLEIKRLYELKSGRPPSAPDTNTWLSIAALNLAHRVVLLERDAARQTRNLEETLTKLLEDASDDAFPDHEAEAPEGVLPAG